MNIPVDYIDINGINQNLNFNISRLAFAKHLAIAGQGYAPRPSKLFRTLGMFLHYSFYMQRQSFNENHFSEPPDKLSDPTEKGQFSNLAGKAIADFLSKRINKSKLTVGYEAEMLKRGIKARQHEKRPDLIAFLPNSYLLAIEAKGSSRGAGNMAKHKTQAKSGRIPVSFCIASVSFNMYKSIRCNYHDPFCGNIQFNNETFRKSSQQYYSGLSDFLDDKYFEINIKTYGQEKFYEIGISFRKFKNLLKDRSPFNPFLFHEILDFNKTKLILPVTIKELSEKGITNEIKPFKFIQEDGLYIDNDRIGLKVR